ncbi:MAG: hypothetical protein J2O46_01145 [Nocardioides sp.]|nr:hypothetical protein [Nocardioides sp.]
MSRKALLWEVVGLAGLIGITTGIVAVRRRQRRSQLTPERVHERLREPAPAGA